MRNTLAISLIAVLCLYCKKSDTPADKINVKSISQTKKDSLTMVKDTTLFVNSSQGEEVKLYINNSTKDSVFESEVFGEMGKSEYRFQFNKNLKTGECRTYRYTEPISINSDPEIKSENRENLSSSAEVSNRLKNIFASYRKVFFKQKSTLSNNKIDPKWYGKYQVTINEDSDDWREQHEIEIRLSKDSITYLAKGYQLYQYYKLSATEKGNSLLLKYSESLDNTDSWVLNKTKDFGKITLEGSSYSWSSPYIDVNFSDGKSKKYILKKQ